ncbi:MAG TPA: hypothetical protein VFV38_51830 [Ktedonobacteraceae bacterium]|nr:hypothetical protein [Ktedonobacteraceae bacterium]
MEQAREEAVMRITAQFVAEQEAGQRPRLEEYARRYPQYVDEITDFVTYYYAVETGLPADTASMPSLSPSSRAALDRAWERVGALPVTEASALSALARRQRCSLSQLASALDLSVDIVEQLARRQFDPATLPRELLQRLASVLAQSISVVRQALGILDPPSTSTLAEARATYNLTSRQSFRAAILASSLLSGEQKVLWQAALEREGL